MNSINHFKKFEGFFFYTTFYTASIISDIYIHLNQLFSSKCSVKKIVSITNKTIKMPHRGSHTICSHHTCHLCMHVKIILGQDKKEKVGFLLWLIYLEGTILNFCNPLQTLQKPQVYWSLHCFPRSGNVLSYREDELNSNILKNYFIHTEKMVVSFRVFKKSGQNGKLTVYLGRRDFIDHVTECDPVDGVILIDKDFLHGKQVKKNDKMKNYHFSLKMGST